MALTDMIGYLEELSAQEAELEGKITATREAIYEELMKLRLKGTIGSASGAIRVGLSYPKPKATVTNQGELLDWALTNIPDELVTETRTVVREATLGKLLAAAVDAGVGVDPFGGGKTLDFITVTTGDPYLRVLKGGDDDD